VPRSVCVEWLCEAAVASACVARRLSSFRRCTDGERKVVCGGAIAPAQEAHSKQQRLTRARARARSPLFGGATQNGATGAAYPGQFNFWADVRGPPCPPCRLPPSRPSRSAHAWALTARTGAQPLSAAGRLLRAVEEGLGAARAEHTPPDALARAAGAGDDQRRLEEGGDLLQR